ncbi:MAG TPA: acetoacetate decarboxylase family protein [Dehalococcoidia bacterium]|nr:acetoacetate decarboxylase family protein [Dehalococcoidia bacterium]
MPLSGVRDVAPLVDQAPAMEGLKTEPAELRGAGILHVMYEIAGAAMLAVLPKALHPTIPPTATFWVWHCPESEAGPFTLAQVRIGCRAGVRPRGWPTAAYCDSAQAAEWLSKRWGFPCREGQHEVRLRHLHDRVVATVRSGGSEILHVELVDPQPISGADVQYTASMHLARVPYADGLKPRLVQVDPEFTFHRAERGRPQVASFDQAAWKAEAVDPVYAVSATYAVADITLPRIRYVMNPDLPAMQGTEAVG